MRNRQPTGLLRFGMMAEAHMKQARPTLYADLERSGKLLSTLLQMQDDAVEAMRPLLEKGVPWHEAFEQAAEPILFLPSEEDQPRLGEGQSGNRDVNQLFEPNSETRTREYAIPGFLVDPLLILSEPDEDL